MKIYFADLDGDGDEDLLTGTCAQRQMYENDGTGVFSLVDPTAFEFDWWFLPVDIDGDGQGADLVHVKGDATGEPTFFVTKRNP